jgi:hypothetical protein
MLDPGKNTKAEKESHHLGRRLASVGVRKDAQGPPRERHSRVRAPLHLLVNEGVVPHEGPPTE